MRCLFFRKIALEWGCCAGFWQMVFFLLWRFFEISSGFVRDASKKVLLLLRQK